MFDNVTTLAPFDCDVIYTCLLSSTLRVGVISQLALRGHRLRHIESNDEVAILLLRLLLLLL